MENRSKAGVTDMQSLPNSRPVIAFLDDGGEEVREHVRERRAQRWRQTLHLLSQLCIAGRTPSSCCPRLTISSRTDTFVRHLEERSKHTLLELVDLLRLLHHGGWPGAVLRRTIDSSIAHRTAQMLRRAHMSHE